MDQFRFIKIWKFYAMNTRNQKPKGHRKMLATQKLSKVWYPECLTYTQREKEANDKMSKT
jgi:hypothetical protein